MADSSKQQIDPEVCEGAKNGNSPNLSADSELQVTCEKSTILHMACKFGNEERTEQILRSHPSLVHEINMKGDTPLHIAARSGHLGVAKLLITCAKTQVVESGMHPLRLANNKKLTVLQEAVQNDHYWVVDLLIKEDPGLTCTTVDGVESPLFMAVEGRFYQIAVRILETFPNCALSGRKGMTIMHAAVIGFSNYILGGTILNPLWAFFNSRSNGKGDLPLEFVDKVLNKMGPEILEEKDEFGWIPLHYAAYIGNKEVVKLFLETNSSLAYIKNKEGMSALHISAQKGHIGIIKILMQKCPNVCELLDNKDQTALHVAARNGNLYVLRTFLRMTCFKDLINEPDKDGNTLLHLAARHSNSSMLMMLEIDRRINKTAINNLGMTAGDIVQSSGQLGGHIKVFSASKLRVLGLFPKSLERIVSEETRMEQLNREKEHETSEDTELNMFAQEDKAAGQARNTSITTAYLTKQDHNYKSQQVENAATVNLLVATIITSITFAAFVTMPGGYDNNNGMPILRKMWPFKFFLVTNSLAFGIAASSMFIHFAWPIFSSSFRYPMRLVAFLTEFSILFAVFAFVGIIYAVLTGKEKIKMSDKAPFPIALVMESFMIPIFSLVITLWYSACIQMPLPIWISSIVEKYRGKEKK